MAIPQRKSAVLPPQKAKPAPKPGAAPGPQVRRLKRGEILFAEGENSRSMYFIKSGMIRIFKKKGNSKIEIDTIRSGAVLGELAFLDGNPRSASGEALTDCVLAEVSASTFSQTLGKMPDWLKILLKTVVGRLRTASTRIRQLEQASTQFDYSDKSGKRSSNYVYISPHDVLKVSVALLAVAARSSEKGSLGQKISLATLTRYGNQIMGVPVAKVTDLMDVFCQVGICAKQGEDEEKADYYVTDIEFLEHFIAYFNSENLAEPSKRHDISLKGFLIMSLMAKHMSEYKRDEQTGITTVNIGNIKSVETDANGGKEPFRMDEFVELNKMGYATAPNIKGQDEVYTNVKSDEFLTAFKLQRVVKAIAAVNEEKT